ncbi:MAG: polyribonucleotide nucleotidyltransferase, partial [Candidatus Hydrogenedentes bacterium]|nr:polyribonucleotide nucleotidyltransferase [Candidatus Hydrogenedentota bacterium]
MIERLSVQVGSTEITFETGRIAKQAHGAVLVTQGDTVVLSAVGVASEARPGQGFFPLTVEYREKGAAAGRIPGNYFRREGRPSEREILVCRMTDRPLRPLFPKGFMNETQVFSTVFSADNINNPDIMSINGASAALHISKIPFAGPIGAVRVGLIGGELVANPSMADMEESALDIVIAGTKDAITMVEGQASELSEDQMLEALEFGHGHIRTICETIETLRERVGVEKMVFEMPAPPEDIVADVEGLVAGRLEEVFALVEKQARQEALDALKTELHDTLLERYGEELFEERQEVVGEIFDQAYKRIMRAKVIQTNRRVDGRALDQIRPISIEVGVLPRAHGSALFTRGETQALVSTTLGTSRDEQRRDELTGEEFQRFMLHYNFPPYSVGEVRRITGPGRREIGHGKLAERAIEKQIPNGDPEGDEFPYTIRVLSDITESNGSSSMATVCGGTLSLMDAGVPLKAPVAGIAMGLIKEGDDACVLSDILGAEDHLGDMDFKVCGTRNGITAFQMDCKIAGVSRALMNQALLQAQAGRIFILDKMAEVLAEPRAEISPYAPRIYTIQIPVDKIRDVIGPGGKVVREIQATTGAEIDIEDDGTINVAAVDQESADAAIEMIRAIVTVPEV